MDGDEEERLDDDEVEEEEEKFEVSDRQEIEDDSDVPKKKIKKNPDVDTSFLPDREREEEETKLREELRQVYSLRFLPNVKVGVSFSYLWIER